MKNLLFQLTLCLICFKCFSQDIESVYRFKRAKQQTFRGTKISYISSELDSLVLYKNGDFYRQTSYSQFDNLGSDEQKGIWKINNNILYLELKSRTDGNDKQWRSTNGKFKYKMVRRRLKPINDDIFKKNEDPFEIFATHILKLVKY